MTVTTVLLTVMSSARAFVGGALEGQAIQLRTRGYGDLGHRKAHCERRQSGHTGQHPQCPVDVFLQGVPGHGQAYATDKTVGIGVGFHESGYRCRTGPIMHGLLGFAKAAAGQLPARGRQARRV
jgi:hypothetical protein